MSESTTARVRRLSTRAERARPRFPSGSRSSLGAALAAVGLLMGTASAAPQSDTPTGTSTEAPASGGPSMSAPAEAQAAPEQEHFTARGNVDLLSSGRWLRLVDSEWNPGNRRLEVPGFHLEAELRPNLRIEYGNMLALIFRPRFLVNVGMAQLEGAWQTEKSNARVDFGEVYGSWRLSDTFSLAYGVQNFQWGPAESLSPSNRIFHETGLLRDSLYSVRGKHLIRANASIGSQWSSVWLVELTSLGEQPFVAGDEFAPAGQWKMEWTSESGDTYLGATVGAGGRSSPWFGEYAQVAVTDGLFLYADASHSASSKAWYPVTREVQVEVAGRPVGVEVDLFEHSLAAVESPARFQTLLVAGARYAFENGLDIRAEYIHHTAGWSREELERAERAAARTPELLGPYLNPGLEYLGQRLLYLSLRAPELPPQKKLALQARYARSLVDDSGAAFLTATVDATESAVLFLSILASHGESYGEFSRLVRSAATFGAVYTW